ncbi:MAG: GNAT family N-acetyltransferase [Lachnospiraceae bacterium]|nr:GNAT family N-acetyltransferase [Lachnospiraceae bacterium]
MTDVIIRTMTKDDYKEAYKLWMTIHNFGISSVDDKEENIHKFLDRNPNLSVVAEKDGEIVGTILCGHDGRKGTFYHVCVREDLRKQGIGKAMSVACMRALKDAGISYVSLYSYKRNILGNSFWNSEGYNLRDDYNTYDFLLNEENITKFNA